MENKASKFILIINAGSSSLKFKLFNLKLKAVVQGGVERLGLSGTFLDYTVKGNRQKEKVAAKKLDQALKIVLAKLKLAGVELAEIGKVGHRVVHGGERFVEPALITGSVLKELQKYSQLAPLHNFNNLIGIEACLVALPQAKNYAVFDTAFHASLPDYAYLYPLPYKIYKKYTIRRYGFHGISCQSVTLAAEAKLKKKKPNLIICHLGSGCSVTAIKAGQSVDTSMGFTPLEGLMMSTRTGDIDPAIIFYLEREGLTSRQVEAMLNLKSGLKGVSAMKDMRDIMMASGYEVPGYLKLDEFSLNEKKLAKLALTMFVYRVKKYIGAYWAVLGKVEAVVFTGGMGERNKDIRNLIVQGLPIKPRVLVVPANEELMMASLIRPVEEK